MLETCRGMKWTYCKTKILCIKLVKYWDKYTEMHGQQNVKKKITYRVLTPIMQTMLDARADTASYSEGPIFDYVNRILILT